jgi:excisionase family DNA binding protein
VFDFLFCVEATLSADDAPQQSIPAKLVKPRQAAVILGRSLPMIWKMLAAGKLEAVRDGPRLTLITMASIDRYVASLPKFVPGDLPTGLASRKRAGRRRA